MFDIGFWELMLIGVVAMLVIGPERLPSVARTAGLWVGRMRRFVSTVKADIDQELKAEELKSIMAKQSQSFGLHEILEETQEALDEVNSPQYLAKQLPPTAKVITPEETAKGAASGAETGSTKVENAQQTAAAEANGPQATTGQQTVTAEAKDHGKHS